MNVIRIIRFKASIIIWISDSLGFVAGQIYVAKIESKELGFRPLLLKIPSSMVGQTLPFLVTASKRNRLEFFPVSIAGWFLYLYTNKQIDFPKDKRKRPYHTLFLFWAPMSKGKFQLKIF